MQPFCMEVPSCFRVWKIIVGEWRRFLEQGNTTGAGSEEPRLRPLGVAVTNYHGMGGLNDTNSLFTLLETRKSQARVLADWILVRNLFLACR